MEKIISFYKTHKRPIVLGTLAVFALSIPIIVAQVLKQQDIRQRASAGDPVTLSFSPPSGQKNIGDEFDVQLLINTNTNDVSAIDGYLKYYDSLLELQSITVSSPYVKIDGAAESNGTAPSVKVQRITLYNPTQQAVTGSNKILVTLRLKALANGTAAIGFSPEPKIAASSFVGNVPLSTASSTTATFTIGTAATATPTTTPTVTAVPTATPTPTTAPTATLVPTVTFAPGETVLQLLVQLPGIGQGAANLGLNATPHRPQRNGEVKILSGNTQVVKTATATMTYDSACSCYKGNFALGASFPSGSYTAKVKFDNSLLKAFPGIINITSGQQVGSAVPTTTLIPGDLNGDNTLGIIDWTLMIACIKNEVACTSGIRVLADLNDNDAVDELDVQILQRGFAIRNGD